MCVNLSARTPKVGLPENLILLAIGGVCRLCKFDIAVPKALRYGTRSQGISLFYLHTPRLSANGMNHTCLCLPSQSWYSFTDPGGMEL